jgi:membrane-bound lytic murein transglycosylase B
VFEVSVGVRFVALVIASAGVMFLALSGERTLAAPESLTAVAPVAIDTVSAEPQSLLALPGGEREDFETFLAGVRSEAVSRGISQSTIDVALSSIEPLPIVVERDRSQAEHVLSLDEYLDRRLTRRFVQTGQQEAREHRTLLRKVSAAYGVQSRFIVAIWGIESNYGRFQGVRPIIPALATLAWDGRRGTLFRGELFNALEIVDRGYIGLEQLQGSWAGAMGQTQFMPSSYLKYAQDFDGNGNRDIWRSHGDIFASIANYLKAHGWSAEHTWGREVRLPKSGALPLIEKIGLRASGCRAHREMSNPAPLARWQALGVRTRSGGALPKADLDASLYRSGNRAFLVYGNYEALLGYNCAHTYALSVAMLADRIR